MTNGEEEDIFVSKPDDVVREVMDDSRKWFHMSDTNSQVNNGVDDTNDPDDELYDSDNFDSLDSRKNRVKGHMDNLRGGDTRNGRKRET
jgi:hypothetical protein